MSKTERFPAEPVGERDMPKLWRIRMNSKCSAGTEVLATFGLSDVESRACADRYDGTL